MLTSAHIVKLTLNISGHCCFGTVTTSMIMLVQDGDQGDKDFNDNLTNECHHWAVATASKHFQVKTNKNQQEYDDEG